VIRIDADRDFELLAAKEIEKFGEFTALPRQTEYGATPDFTPFGEAYPDKLVSPSDYKEVIEECHTREMFPLYHQYATWAPPGFKWNQNGLPYCWAWGAAASLMDLRAREGKPVPLLSPVSLGFCVGWKSRGNYLESAIRGLRERGCCEMEYTPDMHSRRYQSYKEGWEENALQHRIDEVWDCSRSSMVQHAISILATGTPLYIAYNWWGHALMCTGVKWAPRERNSLIWLIRNSHNEDDVIEMTGSRAVPDEAYGFRASK
jgi:hypothetical protein